jgi:hypothetical protein
MVLADVEICPFAIVCPRATVPSWQLKHSFELWLGTAAAAFIVLLV